MKTTRISIHVPRQTTLPILRRQAKEILYSELWTTMERADFRRATTSGRSEIDEETEDGRRAGQAFVQYRRAAGSLAMPRLRAVR